VRGILHSDEDIHGLGSTAEEQSVVRERCGVGEEDAFILFAARPEVVPLALDKLYDRIPASWAGVPKESRRALADGNTQYMRPLTSRPCP
jgi:glutamyl-tRNA(Gln) amidotransferase subunit E